LPERNYRNRALQDMMVVAGVIEGHVMSVNDFDSLHSDLRDIKSELGKMRDEIRTSMIDVAVLKRDVKTIAGSIAVVAGAAGAFVVEVAKKLFF